MSELKPCPFCGGTKVKFIEYSDAIECLTCTALGPDDKIDTWNTRPLEDAKDAEIARLKEDVRYYKAGDAGMSENSECIYCGETGGHHDVVCPMSSTIARPTSETQMLAQHINQQDQDYVRPKPCPFCGREYTKFERFPPHGIGYVFCYKCQIDVMEDVWNNRPLEDAKDAEIARLKDKIKKLLGISADPSLEEDQWVGESEDIYLDEISRLREDKASLEKSILDQSHALVDEIARLRVELEHTEKSQEVLAREVTYLQDKLDKYRWRNYPEEKPEREYADIGDEIIVALGNGYNRSAAMQFNYDNFYSASGTKWTDYVTHWMPLPEPLKEDGNE